MTRVVVTGMGAVCGLGLGWPELWSALCAGASAIKPWCLPEIEAFPVRYAAPVNEQAFARRFRHIDLSAPMEKRTAFGIAAAWQALADAGLDQREYDGCWGVAVGSGVPERDHRDFWHAITERGPSWNVLHARQDLLNPRSGLFCPNHALACGLAERHGMNGPVLNLSTACAGAAHAAGLGFRMIRRGEVDAMLVGGADSVLNLPTMVGLHLLGAPSTCQHLGDRLCRPFDRDRSGLVAAEGAAMLVLEREDKARARGATIYAEIAGFGSSLDAWRITAPHPDGQGAVLSMKRALADAQLGPEDVASINAHGTSTPLNDKAETKAIKAVFATHEHYRRLTVTANKSMLGHLIAAAGAPELIATVLSVREGLVPPTINLDHPDPDCDLDYVPHRSRTCDVPCALSNSFGFGGLNATLAVRRYEN